MPDPIFECPHCEGQWAERSSPADPQCPHCGTTVDDEPIGEEVFMRGKSLYRQCEDIDEMIAATEARAEWLKQLRDEGYEVQDPRALRDDYCTLVRHGGGDDG